MEMSEASTNSIAGDGQSNPSWVDSGFRWLLENLLKALAIAAIAVLAAGLTNYLKRHEIEQATQALKARTEYDTAFSLMGHLSSNKGGLGREERSVYKDLLDHLGKNGFDEKLRVSIDNYLNRDDFDAIKNAAVKDEDLLNVNAPAVQVNKTVDSLVGPTELAVRLYTQIADGSQLVLYDKVKQTFQASSRLKVQAVERVGSKAPQKSDLRYCNNTKQEIAQVVRQQIETFMQPVALRQLPEALCRAVRPNHLELWISKGATK
jgi:hypothetical protein